MLRKCNAILRRRNKTLYKINKFIYIIDNVEYGEKKLFKSFGKDFI